MAFLVLVITAAIFVAQVYGQIQRSGADSDSIYYPLRSNSYVDRSRRSISYGYYSKTSSDSAGSNYGILIAIVACCTPLIICGGVCLCVYGHCCKCCTCCGKT